MGCWPSTSTMEPQPQKETYTAFFYGTLMAPPVLHRVLHGTPSPPASKTSSLHIRPALLSGYQRHKVRHADYPAIVASTSAHTVRGTLVTGLTAPDIRRLDIFEGSDYNRIRVDVRLLEMAETPVAELHGVGDLSIDADKEGVLGAKVEAEVYVWIAGRRMLEAEEWDFAEFVRRKMGRWVGGRRGERDTGFDDVDAAVERGEVDPTGGRGENGDITRELEGKEEGGREEEVREVIRSAV